MPINTSLDLIGSAKTPLSPVSNSFRNQNERVVILTAGDSTSTNASTNQSTSMQIGWPTSLSKALQRMGIPMVATGIRGPGSSTGAGSFYGHGFGDSGKMTADAASDTPGAPWTGIQVDQSIDAGMDHLRAWCRNTNLNAGSSFRGLVLNGSDSMNTAAFDGDPSPLPIIGGLNAHYWHGVDAVDGGALNVEFSVAGGAAAARGSGAIDFTTAATTFGTGVTGMTSIAIAAGAANTRDFQVGWKYRGDGAGTPAASVVTANALMLGCVVEDPARTWGYSIHPLYQMGGTGTAYTCAACLNAQNAEWAAGYFGFLRTLATGAPKKIVVVLAFGFNDRNETNASYKSAIADADSAEAYVDNIDAIRDWFLAVWTANGWDTNELYFAVSPSWQISSPDDAELAAYRAAVPAWCISRPRCVNIDPMQVLDWSVTAHLFDRSSTTPDYIHASRAGRDVYGHAMAMQLIGSDTVLGSLRSRPF